MKPPRFPFLSAHAFRVFLLVFLTVLIVWGPPAVRASETIGFIERFALSGDRAAAVAELVPGTPEFYYFSCLLAQQEGRLAEVEGFLESWVQRHGESEQVSEIRHRQALLRYEDDPAATLEYLKRQLGLSFHHEQRQLDAKPDFPTALPQDSLSWELFLERALQQVGLGQVADSGLDRIIRDQAVLTPVQRRELLGRLRYPDYERLVGLIAADLRTSESRGFGEFEIHRRLTAAQLEELAGLRPEVRNELAFVEAQLLRLRPGGDVSLERDRPERDAYLERLRAYVAPLEPTFNSLKAAVLFQVLQSQREKGEYSRERFLEYLRLPRPVPYMEPRYLQAPERRPYAVDLAADHSATIGFPPVGQDETLVRAYLEHFFVEDESYQGFAPYVREEYLKGVFAETKLLHGIGDASQWYSMLTPGEVQALQERVEIQFAAENPERFSPADPVALTVDLKNVKELIVKVYEINSLNYYLDRKREINTDLELDGLVANEEQIYRYDEAPIRRHAETFAFESMEGRRGTWVVEMIGNGISSRALVRKGRLQPLTMTTPGGEMLRILNENNESVEEGAAWFGGRRYAANEDGFILLPFSAAGEVPVVLTDGSFASFTRLTLPTEEYVLKAGFFVEQETLLPGTMATVVVRPHLSLHGEAVELSLLKEATLTVKTTDLDGIESVSEVRDFELFEDQDSTHAFRVPSRLRRIEATLKGEIEAVSRAGETIAVQETRYFDVNGTDEAEQVSDLFLSRFADGYILEVLGKSGEAQADRSVNLSLRHRDFAQAHDVVLKTGPEGRVALGPLPGIASLTARIEGAGARTWEFGEGGQTQNRVLHAAEGDPVIIPLAGLTGELERGDFAVFETRSGVPVRDVFDRATAGTGVVELTNLEPGDYLAVLRREGGETIPIRVTAAERSAFGYALSGSRHLQTVGAVPVHIASVARAGDSVEIQLSHADEQTRVHLVATRFLPEADPFSRFTLGPPPGLKQIVRGTNRSLYVSGRDIGEEYRYILERRNTGKFPGNMLERPGLILNPWELSQTETAVSEAAAGEDYRRSAGDEPSQMLREPEAGPGVAGTSRQMVVYTPTLNFVQEQAMVLNNLRPDGDGKIVIPVVDLGDRQHLHVVALDGENTSYRHIALPEPGEGTSFRDLRLKETLLRGKNFTQQRNVTLLKEDHVLTIDDLRSAELESYATLAEVYEILSAIHPNESLAKFSFVTGWPDLEQSKKRAIYSEFACHELNFFLSRKDPEFFKEVVRPYLSHKKDKTFLDHYLLENDLESFLAPWEFGRLNIVERILLGSRLGGEERERTADHVENLRELIPPDLDLAAHYFRQALRGRRSDGTGGMGAAGFRFEGGGGAAKMVMEEQEVAFDNFADKAAPGAPAAAMAPVPRGAVQRNARRALMAIPSAAPDGAERLGVDAESLRKTAAQEALYRKLDSTKEWAENNYYQLPIEEQTAELVTVNAFWEDFARWDGEDGFYSREFSAASNNFTEMMMVLGVLDLPFSAEAPELTVEDNVLRFTAKSPVVIFHEEIEEAPLAGGETPILVSQNFFQSDDRFEVLDGERVDKFVRGEFLTGVVYGSQVVVTNPTSSAHTLELLVQIPEGAIPVGGSDYTRSYPLRLNPFSTERLEVSFYFPATSGKNPFALYPVQVARNEQVIATGGGATFRVVDRLSVFDEASWSYLSQHGSEEEVFDYLENKNLHLVDLSEIAWRARESVDFFRRAVRTVQKRHGFDPVLWSYGIHHGDTTVTREFLKHREDFLGQCGKWIDCELVSLDPVERHWYQHLEYAPLVNARAHRLGRERKVLNDRFRSQYGEFLSLLSYKGELDADDRLAVTAYLFLQDRVEEALDWLATIEGEAIDLRLQYDYISAYAALFEEDLERAAGISTAYLDHPVDKWQERFAAVDRQVREIRGAEVAPQDPRDRDSQMEQLSSTAPGFELSAPGSEAKLTYRNLDRVTVNYYEMDLEFLFSSKPFVSGESGQFSYIKPNWSEEKELPADTDTLVIAMPDEFASKNVLVEVVGAGRSEAVAIYSNRLKVQLSERFGRVEVRHEENDRPLPKSYVKVYAKMTDGAVRFFKDGYTDLRGRFDYVSLNTDELEAVEGFSLLVMSEEDGSLVREAKPPQR